MIPSPKFSAYRLDKPLHLLEPRFCHHSMWRVLSVCPPEEAAVDIEVEDIRDGGEAVQFRANVPLAQMC